ncbi:MAG: hypothetical protein AAF125_10625 [Chloroflexota bacterium]
MTDNQTLEQVAMDLMGVFEINTPPIPIESMLQSPRENMWEEVDITHLSSSFLKVNDVYSPRMSLARMLARHVASSKWGEAHEVIPILKDADQLYTFARMLIMPYNMVMELTTGARTPTAMSIHFEVPEEDARVRLVEITGHKG